MLRDAFLEEIAHVELVQTTINQLLNVTGEEIVGAGDSNGAPLEEAIKHANPHHFIISVQSSIPVDTGGNPWSVSEVYNHGNLISDMLYNAILESTGVLQKSRIYEMSSNKTFRETLGFLNVRDNALQNAFAKALETFSFDWRKIFLIPNYDINEYPECKKYVDRGFHNAQFNFRLDQSLTSQIFQCGSPSRNSGTLQVVHHLMDIPCL